MAETKTKPKAQNGTGPADPFVEAFAYERRIAEEATGIRGDAKELTPELLMELWPLLRRTIPAGFIVSTPPTKGKPYPSTGIKSVQVCIDRMDNVLTPLWWSEDVAYFDEGRRCQVTVRVGGAGRGCVAGLFERESMGGVNQASTTGNLYKGSYTNAAKRAFAMVGVGHEVYVGATDFDPDTDPDSAKAQENTSTQTVADTTMPPEKAENLAAIVEAVGLKDHLAAKLRSFGKKEIGELSLEQGLTLYEWTQGAGAKADG